MAYKSEYLGNGLKQSGVRLEQRKLQLHGGIALKSPAGAGYGATVR